MVADVVEAYYREHRLPELPEDGRDEIGLLMRGINCGLREIETGGREMERLSLEDPLTHAMNRRGSEQFLLRCVERAEQRVVAVGAVRGRRGQPQAGQRRIRPRRRRPDADHPGRSGAAMAWRATRQIGRWGGDEFVVCMHEPDAAGQRQGAATGCMRWRAPIENGIVVRASVGCAEYRPGIDAMQLYHEADAAMYRAKAEGGSKLVCHDGERELAHH